MSESSKKGGINPVTAGVVGVAIGVAAGAAAVALADKGNRQKVVKNLEVLKKQGGRKLVELGKKAESFKEEVEEKVSGNHQFKAKI